MSKKNKVIQQEDTENKGQRTGYGEVISGEVDELTQGTESLDEEGESYGVVENEGEYLAFSVDNLYTNEKENKYRNPWAMRKTPPTLEISSSEGSRVSIPLTYTFIKSLLRVLNDVNFAYLGMKKTKKTINMGDTSRKPITQLSDIVNTNKLSLVQLFLGMFLGVFIAKNFIVGIIGVLILSLVAMIVSYSNNNNKKEEEEIIDGK